MKRDNHTNSLLPALVEVLEDDFFRTRAPYGLHLDPERDTVEVFFPHSRTVAARQCNLQIGADEAGKQVALVTVPIWRLADLSFFPQHMQARIKRALEYIVSLLAEAAIPELDAVLRLENGLYLARSVSDLNPTRIKSAIGSSLALADLAAILHVIHVKQSAVASGKAVRAFNAAHPDVVLQESLLIRAGQTTINTNTKLN